MLPNGEAYRRRLVRRFFPSSTSPSAGLFLSNHWLKFTETSHESSVPVEELCIYTTCYGSLNVHRRMPLSSFSNC